MATYPTDATGPFTVDGFSSMEDRKPDKGYGIDTEYSTITFTSEAGYEKRSLRTRRPKSSFSLKYTAITGLQKRAIEDFYKARSGDFESFTFNKSHLNETGTLTVRFDGPLKIREIHSGEANLINNFYTVEFNLKETFD